ncbi:MAG: glycosyltransferase family 4 protein [Demequinaceae bacterium]|nr:glycosyltransferase family 4 protein [Demequinaceae bacterium]
MERVDVFLQYYRPHVSGLTNMAAMLAEHAARAGYDMHVHCVSRDATTSTYELDGVTVHAYRKSFSLGRAVFSWRLLKAVWKMRKAKGIAHVHMPYPESFYLAWVLGKQWKFIATYQCDAPFNGGVDTLIAKALDWSHRQLIKRATISVTSSEDYAGYTRLSKEIADHGPAVVPVTGFDRAGGKPAYAVEGRRLIGFMGRPTFEKGIDVLLEAMEDFPLDDVSLLFAGPVAGLTEKVGYDAARMQRLLDSGRIISVGFLEDEQIADFFASLDLYVHPSINSFDAFGIVQIEAMSAGIPVVASDIPGVRTAVWATGFGEITKAGDAKDLSRGLVKALDGGYDAAHAREVLDDVYLPPQPQESYVRLYERVTG